MRPQQCLLVDVICICTASAWMIGGEAERVEVLSDGHDW